MCRAPAALYICNIRMRVHIHAAIDTSIYARRGVEMWVCVYICIYTRIYKVTKLVRRSPQAISLKQKKKKKKERRKSTDFTLLCCIQSAVFPWTEFSDGLLYYYWRVVRRVRCGEIWNAFFVLFLSLCLSPRSDKYVIMVCARFFFLIVDNSVEMVFGSKDGYIL